MTHEGVSCVSGTLEGSKDELLARAADVSVRRPGGSPLDKQDVRDFLRLYYRHVPVEDLLDRDPVDIYASAAGHRGLAELRPPGSVKVHTYTPTLDEHGWEPGHTVVDVVTDDMPFLVDSVTMALNRHDLAVHLVVHPQFRVRRDAEGRLLEVVSGKVDSRREKGHEEWGGKAIGDAIVESWMHFEIDRQREVSLLRDLEKDIKRVLADVRSAVEDWPRMKAAALRLADQVGKEELPLSENEVAEGIELLRWLADDHFTFLGYREYDLVTDPSGEALRVVPDSGLGILREDNGGEAELTRLTSQSRARAREPKLLVLTKANSRSTVHRPTYLDYIGIKRFDKAGEVVGERRFLGLFTHTAYNESIQHIPLLKRKLDEVLNRAGLDPDSHDGKDLTEVLETYPRDELFQTSTDELLPIALGVLRLRGRRQLKLFLRRDPYGRYISCLVFLPRDRYNTQIRLRLQDILIETFGSSSIEFHAMVSDSMLARLHFVVRGEVGRDLPEADPVDLEARMASATRSWADDFADAVVEQCGEERASKLLRRYGDAFPEAYKEDFPARTAVADMKRLEALAGSGEIDMSLYEPIGAAPGERRFKVYRRGPAISLTHMLPLLQRLGVEVIDERPYEINRRNAERTWIYDFGLGYESSEAAPPENLKRLFQDTFAALWRGDVENDGFNALVLRAGLTWRQAMVLRAYCKYLRQAGSILSNDYIEQTVLANVHIAKLLVELFEARFDPHRSGDRDREVHDIAAGIENALDAVESLDQDRILRGYYRLIQATLRTNYFREPQRTFLSLKLDPRDVPELPHPRPRYETFVYSPRVEGVHLRFGSVARGGIRWSDRREDFRTEILGLAKAQMVKNAVIVPVGAKGGFVAKRSASDPEGATCYEQLIRGMLDVTDNLVDGRSVGPPDVVRHDGDDPYLVVAADKGTAAFSDLANRIAAEYDFWLGDAFASGGSRGYHHKEMGITARGAWESVRHHFRKLGVDPSRDTFTVVGIGDMSGDVFGNGMLLSRSIELVAAFDHRHIFLDPNPDPAVSYRERRRLFELPRSSWADYNTSLISEGGGVFPRAAKQVPVSKQVRERLDLDDSVTSATPHEFIRAILKAPVDLVWNGGIGTYVKASTESHADVGDKANDQVRVDAPDLRSRVVAEGGNLGLTQLARIEYALSGGLVNTDFIDNSAGVDTSDHEVNIKILLDSVVRAGDMTSKQRAQLLEEAKGEVTELVLRDNHDQNVALANARAQAASMLHVHARYIDWLERTETIDRTLEFLPNEKTITERRMAGEGLTSPEFAVLLSHTKIRLAEELLARDLPDDAYLVDELIAYFPAPLRERFRDHALAHPLRRQIVATRVLNEIVNDGGTTFLFRLSDETGASWTDITRAYLVARHVFDIPNLARAAEDLVREIDASTQITLLLEARKLTERTTRWLLHNRRTPLDVRATIADFADGVQELVPRLPRFLVGSDLVAFENRRGSLTERGVPKDLAERVAATALAYSTLDLVEIGRDTGRRLEDVAEIYFLLAEQLHIARLREQIHALPRDDRWQTMARSGLRDDLNAAHAAITRSVIECGARETGQIPGIEQEISAWTAKNSGAVERLNQTISEIWESDRFDTPITAVGVRAVRQLVAASSLQS